ncbi:MAG: nucleotidyl transferase AbiEii/AbiGii toxin family protein [Desulfobacterales bacterium]|uniref:Nucleotidyl transferase AbiEii/AbiGii toxin family protein n=1 Tax=Candidatus Desulfatibia vada TaxID=2841696 RepID=A0A8J6TPI0_9BACT|nr:nucleotidyl transferase AbiEii/AbiGii toxin family protein [Candidatus Desulfatibia vada]MBL6971441.1 nucleotidyl transferase AbiEii/AbiGii toxin family protein [Desulfobacterales bacterium]
MLSIKEIESYYPENLRAFKRSLMREYLQYKILEIIFSSNIGEKLSFLGGTVIRILHGNNRFSEDLDFDNFELTQNEFECLAAEIGRKLKLEGYHVEIKNVFKDAFHCYVRIPGLLFDSGLSGHREEKILIQVDTEPQGFDYLPESVILNKFDVFCRIKVTPPDILLAQKIVAIFERKRKMGRDFYDSILLFGKVGPNFDFLRLKIGIKDMAGLKNKLILLCKELNFKTLARDVEPFLFSAIEAKKVLAFPDYINQLSVK